ncbi:MAG: DUF4190 domain-containing protein [Planctomycetota bacterium]|jgi:hypothetical protein
MDYEKDERSRPQDDPGQPYGQGGDVPAAEPFSPSPQPPQYAQHAPADLPQSTLAVPAFVLGLVGLLLSLPTSCFCYGVPALVGGALGIAAWIMGHRERSRIAAGEVAPNGMVTAAYVLGIIATIMAALTLITLVACIVFGCMSAVTQGNLNQLGN